MYLSVVLLMCYQEGRVSQIQRTSPTMEYKNRINFWSKVWFGWLTQEIQLGNTRPLQNEDLSRPHLQKDTQHVHLKYTKLWNLELKRQKMNQKNPSLLNVVLRSTSFSYKLSVVVYLVLFTSCRILLPVMLNFLLKELSFSNSSEGSRNNTLNNMNIIAPSTGSGSVTGSGSDTGNGSDTGRGSDIASASDTGSEKSFWLYLYLSGLLFVAMAQPFIKSQYYYYSTAMSSYICSGLTGLAYEKILRTQRHKLDDITSGRVINLISKDLEPFLFVTTYVPFTIMAPLEMLLVSLLLWKLVGLESLTGIAYLVFLVLYQQRMGKALEQIRHYTAVFTDHRLRLINDVISGIRVVKMNTLEWVLGNMIGRVRRKEIQNILKTCTILASFLALQASFTIIATFISLVTLMLSGHVITPEKAFTTTIFMSVVRKSGLEYFAYSVKYFAGSKVSLSRIQTFLLVRDEIGLNRTAVEPKLFCTCANEIAERKRDKEHIKYPFSCPKHEKLYESNETKKKKRNILHLRPEENVNVLDNEVGQSLLESNEYSEMVTNQLPQKLNDSKVIISNVTCEINKNNKDKKDITLLRGVDFELGPGSLTALTGRAGSGKSTVLSAILGEIPIVKGSIDIKGSVGLVSQTSWLFSGTVRENILFGSPLDQGHYDKVVHACALTEDFKLLPHGDSTFIGERGLSLSGGQRARVSLARAVYHDFDIYLLDDPLSAVDAKVGRHIFDECITCILSNKIRLLATHHLHYLRNIHEIIVLDNGEITKRGSFDEIASTGDCFTKILDEGHNVETERQARLDCISSSRSEDKESGEKSGMADEDRNVGTVSLKTYWKYFRSYSSLCGCLLMILLSMIPEGTSAGSILWLSSWSALSRDQQRRSETLIPYTALSLATLISSFARAYAFYYLGIRAAEKLHNLMIERILKSPVRFFDTNPTGRILNRFSRDTCGMEGLLLTCALEMITWFLSFVYCCFMVSIVNPYLFLASFPLILGFGIIARYFLRAAREIKRLDAIACSPLYDHFSETFEGAAIIRSFKKEASRMDTLYRCRDLVNQLSLTFSGCKQWLALRVELMCSFFLAAVCLTCILTSKSDALTGLSITYALEVISTSWSLVVEVTNTENSMTSVERILTYTELPQEPGYQSESRCPKGWPLAGSLSYNKVALRYTEDGSLALRDLSFQVNSGEKVGIVGRTGAGKSSIISALFRMPELHSGNIKIDDVILDGINIRDSRSAIACIPQNPFLFSESLRFNLDPFGERNDAELWLALEEVQLRDLVLQFYEGLCFNVSEGGTNFSVGERQLLCMARALLQGKKIIVLDEATAHIDFRTDKILQNTIRERLKDRTVITIAHRLDTVLDYDKIIVLEEGRAVEIGTPSNLLNQDGSVFGYLYKVYTSGKSH